VVEHLHRTPPAAARAPRRAYSCFDPYYEDVQEYARATALVPTSCEDEAVSILGALRAGAPLYREDGRDAYFNAEQNALVARDAERYYRTMVRGGPTSWNVRDHHMVDTLNRLMDHHGRTAKAIVWEHNTHVGDARFTDMRRAGMVNVGQLVREGHGEDPHERDGVVLVGFGSYRGTVIAGDEWGAPMRRMRVPEGRQGSWEDILHRAHARNQLHLFDGSDDGGIAGLDRPLEHRAIGVVYDPAAERWGNYVPTIVPRRYDAFLYVDQTKALDPLHMPVHVGGDEPETYPTGMSERPMDRWTDGPSVIRSTGPSVFLSIGPPVLLLRGLALQVRVALQPGHVVRDEVVPVRAVEVLCLGDLPAEGLQQVRRPELHVVEHLGHRIAVHEVADLVAVVGEADVHGVGVAEQVVEVAQDLLIGTGEEHAQDVRLPVAPLVQRK
jgi:hypothetical protein